MIFSKIHQNGKMIHFIKTRRDSSYHIPIKTRRDESRLYIVGGLFYRNLINKYKRITAKTLVPFW